MGMSVPTSFKRLILRAVLRNVNPMVIRLVAAPDFLDLADFDEISTRSICCHAGR